MNFEHLEQPIVTFLRHQARTAPSEFNGVAEPVRDALADTNHFIFAINEHPNKPQQACELESYIYGWLYRLKISFHEIMNSADRMHSIDLYVVPHEGLNDDTATSTIHYVSDWNLKFTPEEEQLPWSDLGFKAGGFFGSGGWGRNYSTPSGIHCPNLLCASVNGHLTVAKYEETIKKAQNESARLELEAPYRVGSLVNPSLDESSPPKNYFVFDKLPKGDFGFIAGPSGVGKSWILGELGLAVSSGKSAFDGLFKVHEPGASALFLFEDDSPIVTQRLKAISKRLNIGHTPMGIMCRDNFRSIGAHDAERRRQAIEDTLEGISNTEAGSSLKLVGIDPLKNIMLGRETDDTSVMETVEWLGRVAYKYHCGVLVCHHTSEASQRQFYSSGGGLDQTALRGHGSFAGSSRWTLNISPASKSLKEENIAIKTSKVSHGPTMKEPVIMRMVSEAGEPLDSDCFPAGFSKAPEALKAEKVEPDSEEARKNVLKAIHSISEPRTKEETESLVREATGLSRKAVRASFTELLESGEITAKKDGRKQLITASPPSSP